MRSIELEITNATGLHARPAAVFVRTAAGFRSAIRVRNVERDGPGANAKSILSVLAQGVGHRSRIEILTDGDDEDAALEALARVVAEGLGEGIASTEHAPGPPGDGPAQATTVPPEPRSR